MVSLFILIVVMISGCTIPGTDVNLPDFGILGGQEVKEFKNDIIVISDIQAIPSRDVKSGQTMKLRVYLKNLEGVDAEAKKNVEVRLYNVCDLFDTTIDYCPGTVSNDICIINNFYPQSTQTVSWELRAKHVNVETSCDIGIYVKYDHKSFTTTQIAYINKDEYERLILQGKKTSEKGKMVVGEGPIKAYLEVKDQPVLVSNENPGITVLYFWLENKGNGELDGNKIYPRGTGKNTFSITSDNIIGINNENIQTCIEKKLPENNRFIEFIGKSTPKYMCKIKLSHPQAVVETEKIFSIDSEINYAYKFSKKLEITVKP